jgi:hypothetical protein
MALIELVAAILLIGLKQQVLDHIKNDVQPKQPQPQPQPQPLAIGQAGGVNVTCTQALLLNSGQCNRRAKRDD